MLCGISSLRNGELLDTKSARHIIVKVITRPTGVDFRHGGGVLLLSLAIRYSREIFKLNEMCVPLCQASDASRVGLSEHAEVSATKGWKGWSLVYFIRACTSPYLSLTCPGVSR